MRLYLLRHAEAAGGVPDAERPLTPEGIRDMEKGARGLARAARGVRRVLSSPLVRARETAAIAAKALELEVEAWESLAPGKGVRLPSETSLLVGHAPDLDALARRLTGARIRLKKGAACCIEDGRLAWLLSPRQLRLMGRRR